MNLSEIRDLIRAEAGIQGLDEYTTLIDAILNQELQQITGKSKYEELRTNFTFTSIADGMYEFDLPEDFQLFADLYFFQNGDDPELGRSLVAGIRGRSAVNIAGYPTYYVIMGRKLQVYPYTDFYLDDYLKLAYYKKPVLVNDTDEFPVPSLEKSVQQAVMARMLRQVDTKRSQMAKADANEAYLASRAENAANV